jgi:hypothetical protein
MFLDNATSHIADTSLSNVTLKFLPANTTSAIQPLDQGIIQAFKSRYRKQLMIHLLAKMDSKLSASQLAKSITVLDAIYWIDNAWADTKPSTITSCFKACGFVNIENDTAPEEDTEDDLPLSSFLVRLMKS